MADLAFVAGGTRGIGAATVLSLARQGIAVAIGGRDRSKGEALAEAAKAAGARDAVFVKVDMACAPEIEAAYEQIAEHFDGQTPSMIVASAATGGPSHKPFYELEAADIQRVVDINFTAVANLVRLGWRRLRACGQSGAMVLISSIGSAFDRHHARYIPLYSPTKAGIDQLVRSLALPALADNIRIYGCNPGVTDTDMGRGVEQSMFPYDNIEDFAAAYNPSGKPVSADKVGNIIVQLLQGRLHHVKPGDCLACFESAETIINMQTLYSHMGAAENSDSSIWQR